MGENSDLPSTSLIEKLHQIRMDLEKLCAKYSDVPREIEMTKAEWEHLSSQIQTVHDPSYHGQGASFCGIAIVISDKPETLAGRPSYPTSSA